MLCPLTLRDFILDLEFVNASAGVSFERSAVSITSDRDGPKCSTFLKLLPSSLLLDIGFDIELGYNVFMPKTGFKRGIKRTRKREFKCVMCTCGNFVAMDLKNV